MLGERNFLTIEDFQATLYRRREIEKKKNCENNVGTRKTSAEKITRRRAFICIFYERLIEK